MKQNSKLLSILLDLLLMVGVFVACQSTGDPQTTTDGGNKVPTTGDGTGAESGDVTTDETYTLPKEDLNGYSFNIYSIMGPATTWLTFPYFDTEDSSTKISSAIYNRNTKIEEDLKCTITELNAGAGEESMWNSLLADDQDVYQAGTDYSWDSITRSTTNYLVDFQDISTVELDKPWWDQNLNDAYAINGRIFVTSGSAMTSSWDEIFVLYFNTTIASDLDAEMNLYQEVKDGKWTLDRLHQLILAADTMLNDGGDEDDTYGLSTQAFYAVPSLLGTNNITYGLLNDQGKVENATLSEVFLNTALHLAEKFAGGSTIYYGNDECDTVFTNGNALFLNQCIGDMTRMRDLDEFDYGILPMPKYTEEQDRYYSYSGAQYLLFVPYTCGDLEKTGIVLNAMMGLSEYTLKQVYVEDMLGQIYSRTPEASEMLFDYVLPNTLYDVGGRSGLRFNTVLPLDTMIPGGMTEIASMIDAAKDIIQAKVEAANGV